MERGNPWEGLRGRPALRRRGTEWGLGGSRKTKSHAFHITAHKSPLLLSFLSFEIVLYSVCYFTRAGRVTGPIGNLRPLIGPVTVTGRVMVQEHLN